MIREPRVSVILPAYNRLLHLRTAVESVLAQTCPDFELIVADDGSAAETRAWLGSLHDARLRVLFLAHSGVPSAVRNAAIREARGRYLAFIDSDDEWLPAKLERQLALLAAHPDCRWSYHASARIDAEGRAAPVNGVRPFEPLAGDIVEPLLEIAAFIATPTVMAERALVAQLGGFDEGQYFAEDYDLWLRLAMSGPVCLCPDALTRVRVHTDNYSQDRIGAWRGWVRLYEKMSGMVPTPRLRDLCRRRRASCALKLAAMQWRARQRGAAMTSLWSAARGGWRDATWWREFGMLATTPLRQRT